MSASDEKWSDWIEWGGGDCPLPSERVVDIKTRSGQVFREMLAENVDWGHGPYPVKHMDVLQYRYRTEEPTKAAEGMHPDLEWLARNVSEWTDDVNRAHVWLFGRGNTRSAMFCNSQPAPFPIFSYNQWLQARKDLGLIMSDEEMEMPAEEWKAEQTDNVNKPKHYQLREGYEVYDLRQDLAAKAANGGATYDQYSDWDRAIEYIIRMWDKNRLEDAKKGRWYLDKLIEKLE